MPIVVVNTNSHDCVCKGASKNGMVLSRGQSTLNHIEVSVFHVKYSLLTGSQLDLFRRTTHMQINLHDDVRLLSLH